MRLSIFAIVCLAILGCKSQPEVSSNELFEDQEIVEGLKSQNKDLTETQEKL